MDDFSFEQLLEIYRRVDIGDAGEGTLLLENQELVKTLKLLVSAQNYRAAQISLLDTEDSDLEVGRSVRLHIGAPKTSLGLLVKDFDALLKTDGALLREPSSYFLIDEKISSEDRPANQIQVRYRQLIGVMKLIAEAASYVDETRRELVFITDSKIVIPLRLSGEDIQELDVAMTAKLAALFSDTIHREQKLAILAQSLVKLVSSQGASVRLAFALRNLADIVDEVSNGYRLFASSFSYSKVRGEMEAARLDLIGKIHKTIVDIQGQLLGIPVATIVVAAQLKEAPDCGLPFWGNTAVIFGAWVFIALLMVAIVNQYLTLKVIAEDVERQQRKLKNEYAALGDAITNAFDGLDGRIIYHKAALVIVGLVALAAAVVATISYLHLSARTAAYCAGI
jgi:hypothetical protein